MRKVYFKLIECLHSIWCSKSFTLFGIILVSSLLGKYTLGRDDPGNLNIVNTKDVRTHAKRWWTACELFIFFPNTLSLLYFYFDHLFLFLTYSSVLYKSLCIFNGNLVYIGERLYIIILQNLCLRAVLIFLYYFEITSIFP